MKIISNDDIKLLGTILGVWAHPDDETFCAGGIIATAAANGQKVICVTATKGEKGVQDESRWPQDHLASIREAELHDAMSILGVKDHEFLDYPDGGCNQIDQNEAITKLTGLIEKYQPDSILTFGLDGLTGHPDHKAISAWATEAVNRSNAQIKIFHSVQTTEQYAAASEVDNTMNFFYNTPKPPVFDEEDTAVCLRLSEELFNIKLQALHAMPSQYQIMFEKFNPSELKICFGIEAFIEPNKQ